ncbi:hypothetical protein Tco_0545741 [Tanacetum coccineum]
MHKESQQAAGGSTSLWATSEEGAHPQLNSSMFAIYIVIRTLLFSFLHCTLICIKLKASTDFPPTAKVDPRNSTPNDSIHAQQGMDEGTKNNYIITYFVGTNPSVLVDQTKSPEDGLKTAHIDSGTNEESRADEISKKIKLEDLSDLLKDTRSAFFTLNSLQDEPIIVSDESEERKLKKMTLMLLLMMYLKTLQSHILHLQNRLKFKS